MGGLSIGKYTYGSPIRRGSGNNITIGKYCSIASNVILDSGFNHNTKYLSTYPFPAKIEGLEHLTGYVVCKGDINIGNDVWICENTIIMSGVTIGDGASIGINSIITKDVAPYTIVAGSPGRVIKKRFDDDVIGKLLEMKWWNWTDEQVKESAHILMSENVNELYNYYKKIKL